jgi:hypothetical protein
MRHLNADSRCSQGQLARPIPMNKLTDYAQLVAARKACHLCSGLTNPADVEAGRFDSEHIGAWSLWQGNLDASIMVVGQDWGNTTYFVRREGREGPRNPTNLALVELVGIAGISIGDPGSAVGRDIAFFTNAILCLKGSDGGLQGKVQRSWFDNCTDFLRRQIEYCQTCCGGRPRRTRLSSDPSRLPNDVRPFPLRGRCAKRQGPSDW